MNILFTFVIAYSLGFIGMVAHWAKRWDKGETISSLSAYILNDKLSSFKALLAMLIAVTTALSVGTNLQTTEGIALIILAGYGSDSVFNKEKD